MTGAVGALVTAGLALAGAVGLAGGLDLLAALLLGLAAGMGALGVAAARRTGGATVGPRTCGACAGLNSPSAPYCKHCGAPASTEERSDWRAAPHRRGPRRDTR